MTFYKHLLVLFFLYFSNFVYGVDAPVVAPATIVNGTGSNGASSHGQQLYIAQFAKYMEDFTKSYKATLGAKTAIEEMKNWALKDSPIQYLTNTGEALNSLQQSYDSIGRTTTGFINDPWGIKTIENDIKDYEKLLNSAENKNDSDKIKIYTKALLKLKRIEWLKKSNKIAKTTLSTANQSQATKISAGTDLRIEQMIYSTFITEETTTIQTQKKRVNSKIDSIGRINTSTRP